MNATIFKTAAQPAHAGVWRPAVGLAAVALLLFGLAYSMAGVGLGQLLFPAQANGSLLVQDGRVVGSALVAQPFTDARYFAPRPSAAAYDPMAASGSNQARSNPALAERIAAETQAVAQREGIAPEAVPADLVTQSASGVDPDISPASAEVQIARVARARGVPPAAVRSLVERHTAPPTLGVLGEARVNVLALNLALDRAF